MYGNGKEESDDLTEEEYMNGRQLTLSRNGVDTTFPHNARCIQHVSKLNAQSKQVIA
jgi:hypothetical protein